MTSSAPEQRPPQAIRMVDLFAGPGGIDVAARWLGIPTVGVEWDNNACLTRDAARLGTRQGDVRAFHPTDFPDATILAGGPPCQTFTLAGTGKGRRALDKVLSFVRRMADGEDVQDDLASLNDERTGLVLEPLRWALEAKKCGTPYDAIMLEQVPAVLPVWVAIGQALNEIGYEVATGVLNAEEYGVPQTRRRAILVARRDRAPALPRPTHKRFRKLDLAPDDLHGLLPYKTMGKVLQRGEEFTVISNYGSGGDPKARGRRGSHEPAFTVTGKISRNRLVTSYDVDLDRFDHSEAGILQTFPADYPWSGMDISQQIGNAIPPRLAAHVLAAATGNDLDPLLLDKYVDSSWNAFDQLPHLLAHGSSEGSNANRSGTRATRRQLHTRSAHRRLVAP